MGVTSTAKFALPSEMVSRPLVRPTSAVIFSVFDDELVLTTNTTWTPRWLAIAAFAAFSTEPVVTSPAYAGAPRAAEITSAVTPSASA